MGQQLGQLATRPHPVRDKRPYIGTKKSWKTAWRQRLITATLVLSDTLLAFLLWGLAATVLQIVWLEGPLSAETINFTFAVTNTAVWIGMRALLGLYPGYGMSSPEELRRQTYSTLAALAITTMFAFAFQVGSALSRPLFGLTFLELLFLAPLVRHFVKYQVAKIGLWGKPVVILGAGETGKQLVLALQREWGLGFKPVAVFDFPLAPRGGVLEGETYEETVAGAIDLGRKLSVDTVVFAMPHVRRKHLVEFVDRASVSFHHVLVVPNLGGVVNSAVVARDLAGMFGVEIKQNLLLPWPRRTKRALDLCGAAVGGLLISPLLLAIGALIKLTSSGPMFYTQSRLGAGGRYFRCWKFRTMISDAEAALQRMLEEDPEACEEYRKYHKLRDDPRVTKVGRFLRKTSLDELPQLWNVLRGEMSLVGPRPYLPRESDEIGVTQGEILRVPPGITGPWQVGGRNGTYFEERIQIDAYYVRNWSIWLDLVILARTVRIVLAGRGAC